MNGPGGSPVCAEKKHFFQLEQRLGPCYRLMMNRAFIIPLTHWNTVRQHHLWFWLFVLLFSYSEKTGFFLFFLLQWIKGGRDRSNKGKKKIGKQGRVYYKVNSIKNASEWMYGPCVAVARQDQALINHQLLCFGHDTAGRGELIWLSPYFWKTAVTDSFAERSL